MMMPLPDALAHVISRAIKPFSLSSLREASQSLSTGYRSRENIRHTLSPVEVAAYMGARFPSTYAAASRVWQEAAQRLEGLNPATVLDAGSGPGTASWAAHGLFPDSQFTLFERDASWRPIALSCAGGLGAKATFVPGTIEALPGGQSFDAVVACYALNELPAAQATESIARLWQATNQVLIVIEPGTPAGFEVVRRVRSDVLLQGGATASPCTHDLPCPMSGTDWCHFPVRVSRSSLQRELKFAELSYEDEKFSYVILSRTVALSAGAGRIVRKPIRPKGHIHLDLCQAGKISRTTVSRKHGDLYRQARRAEWGDLWPPQGD